MLENIFGIFLEHLFGNMRPFLLPYSVYYTITQLLFSLLDNHYLILNYLSLITRKERIHLQKQDYDNIRHGHHTTQTTYDYIYAIAYYFSILYV